MNGTLVRLAGAIALALLLAPSAPSAAPTPGVEYDEIVRVLVPPAPVAFDVEADRAAALRATPQPVPRRGRGAPPELPFAVAARDADAAFGAYAPALAAIPPAGRLRHVTIVGGRERIDDPAAATATIWRCDLGERVVLDLRRKTYRVESSDEPAAPTAPPAARRPGSATIAIEAAASALPARVVGDLPVAGIQEHATATVRGAAGSCGSGDRTVTVATTTWFGRTESPALAGCPLGAALPEGIVNVVAPPGGGCRPSLSATRSGPAVPPGRLVVARLVTVAERLAVLLERVEIRPVDAPDPERFEPPQGFTREP